MKRFAWIIGLIFCTICTIQAKDRVIERPPFLAWSSNSIEIDKIVMSDTVTTVYIKAFYRPKYWIKIATGSFLKDNNGMLYPIRKKMNWKNTTVMILTLKLARRPNHVICI